MSARPLRGSVAARAFLFDPRLLGDVEARRRVLAAWRRGARVVALDGAWLLVLAEDTRVRCDRSPGLPFVRSGARLLAASDAVSSDAPGDAVVWLDAGALRCESLALLPSVDVSQWFDAGPVEVVTLKPLARPPAAPRIRLDPPPPLDARERLGVPAAAPESADLRRLLLEGQATKGEPRPARASGPPAPTLLARFVRALRGLLAAPARGAGPSTLPPPKAPATDPWWAPLRRVFDRVMFQSRLAQLIGRQHAKYLRRMLDLFESGDVQDALRHAIPLGNDLESKLQTWTLPRARTSLAIRPQGDGPTSVWGLGGDLYKHLQQTYRSMFQRLEAQGRIEEAAFVLAELLRADAEAVAFLERHGRLKLAAELAEGRNLPPGLQVRQWFLAGDRARAMALALRHGAFADAAQRLQKEGKLKELGAWSLLWADALADAGDMLGAAEVVAFLPHAQHLALGWLDAAIAQGGPTGARALVRKLGLRADAFPDVRDRAIALLGETHVEGVPARVAFADAVSVGRRGPELSVLARVAARALVRDLALHGPGRLPPRTVERMIGVANDGALRTDVPSLPDQRPGGLADCQESLLLDWPASDVGRLAVTDAAFLPDGRVVAALGEVGVRLYQRDGRVVAHFDQPAHRLVVSDVGDRLIALASRGGTQRLARVDLARRRAESWCEAPIEAWAPDYDGRRWFVGVGDGFSDAHADGLYAIDATVARWEALWRVPDLIVLQVQRGDGRLDVVAEDVPLGSVERFAYELPSLVLRKRESIPFLEGSLALDSHVDEKGDVVASAWLPHIGVPGPKTLVLVTEADPAGRPLPDEDSDSRVIRVTRAWVVIARKGAPGGSTVALLDRRSLAPKLRLRLGGATEMAVRVVGDTMTVADDRGRVIVLDLVDGLVLRDLRVV